MAYAPHSNTDVRNALLAKLAPPPLLLGGFSGPAGGRFEYVARDTSAEAFWTDYPHRVYVGVDGDSRVARVLKTVAHVIVDEAADGSPVVERWPLRGHDIYDTKWVEL